MVSDAYTSFFSTPEKEAPTSPRKTWAGGAATDGEAPDPGVGPGLGDAVGEYAASVKEWAWHMLKVVTGSAHLNTDDIAYSVLLMIPLVLLILFARVYFYGSVTESLAAAREKASSVRGSWWVPDGATAKSVKIKAGFFKART